MKSIRLLGLLALGALLPACESSSSGGAAALPEIAAFVARAGLASGGTADMGLAALNEHIAVPVTLVNEGSAALDLTGAVGVTPTNCAASVRDLPPAAIAPGERAVFTLLVTAGTSGNPSVLVSVPSNDADENPFTFTLNYTLATTSHAIYLTTPNPILPGATSLVSSSFPGAATITTLNPAITTGIGVTWHWHLLDRALFTCRPAVNGPTDLYLKGLGASLPATPLNLTSTLTNMDSFISPVAWANGDTLLFGFNAGGGAPARLFSLSINGASASAPVEISGALPAAGSPFGLMAVALSPRRDLVAFVGDFDSVNTVEIFVAPVAGGPRTKVASTPPPGRFINPGVALWLPDQSGLIYNTHDAAGQLRELHLVRLGPPLTVTRLNGVVPAGRTGVDFSKIRVSASADRIFYLSDEASATGQKELYAVRLTGGVPGPAVGLNGASVPGTAGVADFGVTPTGAQVLFTADSGTSGRPELWHARLAGAVPTTTKIAASTSNVGVEFDAERGVFSETRAWCLRDDLVNDRHDVHFVDLSLPVPALTRFPDTGSAVGGVFPQANGRLVYSATQGANTRVLSSELSATPGTVTLSSLRSTTSQVTVLGNGVAFEGDNGAAPQEVFFNLMTGGAEVQVDGAELAGASSGVTSIRLYSADRIFYQFFTATNDQVWNANASGTITRDRTDSAASVFNGGLRLGNEPR